MSDSVIRAVADKDGVIGLVLYNDYLEPRWQPDKTLSVTLDQNLRNHARHIADLKDWSHVGIGSDLDGGFGLEECPLEIDTVADPYYAGLAVHAAVCEAALTPNWLNFLRKPAA